MTNPVYRSATWRAVRLAVLERDGRVCMIRLPGCMVAATAVDHIVELEDGGAPYAMENLQAACRPCNTAKRNRSLARRARRGREAVRQW